MNIIYRILTITLCTLAVAFIGAKLGFGQDGSFRSFAVMLIIALGLNEIIQRTFKITR